GVNFAASGSSAGAITNLDGGLGGQDLGSNSNVQNSNFFDPRSSTMVSTSGSGTAEFLIGTVQYHVTAVGGTSASSSSLNFSLPTFTSVFAREALFYADGASRNELNSTITVGTAITFSNGPADAYWKGGQSTTWSTDNGTTSALTNWTS